MSTDKKELDPRIKRTLHLIRDALISLMEEKGFEHITVRDITGRAEINRATFYLHYRDKYDLLDSIVNEMLSEFEAAFRLPDGFTAADFVTDDTPPDSFIRQFEHIAAHAAFYKVMLGPSGLPGFASRMEAIIRNSLYRRSTIAQPDDRQVAMPRDIIVRYVTSAHMGVLMYWLENDMHYSPKYMASELIRLHRLGSTHFFESP
ncbi:TetR/AcrR family transcriptional regulator [Paenibacillus kobensis]|uniref:TetR/AcrR family transcriptional regulator n=1 Tax=Paenibacillus kobensis TaxID=59841 RepID=UPI0013E2EA85|nr:TetR/AcrR family transcriptional regulator C-terminal domain-containing protein [Paenibacillus kobensis]